MERESSKERTFDAFSSPLSQLLRSKEEEGHRISVVLPALDEEATIGVICETIR